MKLQKLFFSAFFCLTASCSGDFLMFPGGSGGASSSGKTNTSSSVGGTGGVTMTTSVTETTSDSSTSSTTDTMITSSDTETTTTTIPSTTYDMANWQNCSNADDAFAVMPKQSDNQLLMMSCWRPDPNNFLNLNAVLSFTFKMFSGHFKNSDYDFPFCEKQDFEVVWSRLPITDIIPDSIGGDSTFVNVQAYDWVDASSFGLNSSEWVGRIADIKIDIPNNENVFDNNTMFCYGLRFDVAGNFANCPIVCTSLGSDFESQISTNTSSPYKFQPLKTLTLPHDVSFPGQPPFPMENNLSADLVSFVTMQNL